MLVYLSEVEEVRGYSTDHMLVVNLLTQNLPATLQGFQSLTCTSHPRTQADLLTSSLLLTHASIFSACRFFQGGSTAFPTLEVEATPAKGRVLVFYDCEPGSYAHRSCSGTVALPPLP